GAPIRGERRSELIDDRRDRVEDEEQDESHACDPCDERRDEEAGQPAPLGVERVSVIEHPSAPLLAATGVFHHLQAPSAAHVIAQKASKHRGEAPDADHVVDRQRPLAREDRGPPNCGPFPPPPPPPPPHPTPPTHPLHPAIS